MFNTVMKMAYKNIFLRKGRSILLVLMIGVSMGVMVSLEGLYDGMYQRMIDKTMRSDSGEVSLYAKQYRLEKDIAYRIKDSDNICKTLEKMPNVKFALYRIKAEGLAQTATKSRPASIIGINLEDEKSFGKFEEFLQKGKLELGKNDALIGSELAKNLKIKIGSKVIFSTQDVNNEIQSTAFRIKAIVRTSNVLLDNDALFIARQKAAAVLAVSSQSATQIALRSKTEAPAVIKQELEDAFPSLDVKTFKELYPQLKQMQSMMSVFNGITFIIVMIVVFIGILGVMYVNILDRVREFGILLSIGYAYRYIRLQIMLESVFLGLSGYILGTLIGLALLNYLKVYGLDLKMFADGMESFGMDSVIYAAIESSYFISTFIAIILASVTSVFLPLRKIKKLNPVEVIRSIG